MTDGELRDMAAIACQEALAFGVNEDAFMKLARSVRDRCAKVDQIDYRAAVEHCFRTLGHPQGTKGCIAFARGAEWARERVMKRLRGA